MHTRTMMQDRKKIACLIAVTFACCCGAAKAQAVVHALGGTLQDISPAANNLTLNTDDGSSGSFQLPPKPEVNLNFDKEVRAGTTSLEKVTANGEHVILYYFWNGDARTAVAVQSLGSGPFQVSAGKVVGFNKHDHVLTLKTADGKTETVQVSDKTVVDTADGVAPGARFHVGRGDDVRLLADSKNGSEEALLIRTYTGD